MVNIEFIINSSSSLRYEAISAKINYKFTYRVEIASYLAMTGIEAINAASILSSALY